jgi:hypothetical protein
VELGKEIFSILGYRDGGRFYSDEQDPRVAKAMGMVQALQECLGQGQELLERRDEVDHVKLQEMALTLKNASDKVAAEIDNIEADTAKKLAEAKARGVADLMARAVNPTARTLERRARGPCTPRRCSGGTRKSSSLATLAATWSVGRRWKSAKRSKPWPRVWPWRRRRIEQLQNQLWRARSFKGWLAELVNSGKQAEEQLEELAAE